MGPARVFLFAGLREERAEAPARLEASGRRVPPGGGELAERGAPRGARPASGRVPVAGGRPRGQLQGDGSRLRLLWLACDGERGLEGKAGGDALAILVLLESFISKLLLENSQWSLSTNLLATSRCDGKGTRHVSLH